MVNSQIAYSDGLNLNFLNFLMVINIGLIVLWLMVNSQIAYSDGLNLNFLNFLMVINIG
jgi:ABC-type Mn2+/Zn2+ transport system permease subunit